MRMLTAKEVAQTLNLRLARVYELTRLQVLPVVRLGPRQLRYESRAISEWVKGGGIKRYETTEGGGVSNEKN